LHINPRLSLLPNTQPGTRLWPALTNHQLVKIHSSPSGLLGSFTMAERSTRDQRLGRKPTSVKGYENGGGANTEVGIGQQRGAEKMAMRSPLAA
jgi:hypothetical protein